MSPQMTTAIMVSKISVEQPRPRGNLIIKIMKKAKIRPKKSSRNICKVSEFLE